MTALLALALIGLAAATAISLADSALRLCSALQLLSEETIDG